jgi:hypothetical protein
MPAPLNIDFGQLLTDEPAFRNPGVIRALNVIPRASSFGPFRKLTTISSNALAARTLGAISAEDASGNIYVYAGTAAKLYEMLNNTFVDESKGGGYSTAVDDAWEFLLWADNSRVIATNYADPVQSMAIGGGAGGAFADMITSTNKPKAKYIAGINRFVVLAFTNDATDGVRSRRVWWGGIGDEADFDPDAATQCDFQDIATGGILQGVVGGDRYGLVFQSNAVNTMEYVGRGLVFEILPLNYAPGTPLPGSVIAYKGNVFYISEAGFEALRGTQVEHIGTRRVDRTFWKQFDITNRRHISSAIDPVNKIVAWGFPGAGSVSNLPNRILMCQYDELKWAEAEIDTELLLATRTQGYTLDSLDDLGNDIDDASVFDESLDSDKWKGGAFRFAAFNQLHQLAHFKGATLAATIETGDVQPVLGRNWLTNGAQIHVDGGDARLSVAKRARLKDAVTYGAASDTNINGFCPLRSEGRYQRFRLSLSSSTSWSHAQGLGVDYVLRGKR